MGKLEITKDCVVLHLNACGPCTTKELLNECRDQAYPGMLSLALAELKQDGLIRWSDEDQAYDAV